MKNILLQLSNLLPNRPDCEYNSLYQLVAQLGKPFRPRKLPTKFKLGPPKECFSNAARLALSDPEIEYVEGYYMIKTIPIPLAHAWCTHRGKMLEVTAPDPHNHIYMGITIRKTYLSKTISRKGEYGILDNWKEGWPLLTGKHKTSDAFLAA